MKISTAKNTDRSKSSGRLLCERLAKASKIPMKVSSTTSKTYRVNPRIESKKTIPIKAGSNSTTSTAKKTAVTAPAKIEEDGVKKAIREAVEAKARLLNRREQERKIKELRRAAREALEKVELSVEVEDSHESVRDLERICGGFHPNNLHSFGLCFKC